MEGLASSAIHGQILLILMPAVHILYGLGHDLIEVVDFLMEPSIAIQDSEIVHAEPQLGCLPTPTGKRQLLMTGLPFRKKPLVRLDQNAASAGDGKPMRISVQ